MVINLKNKRIIIILLIILVIGSIIFISNDSSLNDESYYVEANGNVFIYIAKLCDSGCYHVASFLLSGLESLFSNLIGG